jgi:uncharacterized protein
MARPAAHPFGGSSSMAITTSDEFVETALRNPANHAIVEELAALALPDAWLVSGCLVQTVWNALTRRPLTYGIRDYDLFYFDTDTSWDAEDAVIRLVEQRLGSLGARIEIRNQARVHLWYEKHHGLPYSALVSSTQSIERFLTTTTQIGIRRGRDGYDIYAPHGIDDAVRMIVRPNPGLNFSAANYEAKATRWKALWPELTVYPADDGNSAT